MITQTFERTEGNERRVIVYTLEELERLQSDFEKYGVHIFTLLHNKWWSRRRSRWDQCEYGRPVKVETILKYDNPPGSGSDSVTYKKGTLLCIKDHRVERCSLKVEALEEESLTLRCKEGKNLTFKLQE